MKDGAPQALVERIKEWKGAAAVALLDIRNGRMIVSTEETPSVFWTAVTGIRCLPVVWTTWYRDLLASKDHRTTCDCGERHELCGLIEKGWALLIVKRERHIPDESSDLETAMSDIEESLVMHALVSTLGDRARTRRLGPRGRPGGGEGGSGSAELGIPLWWRRKVENRGD
jgi:hypothetical protein